jgi:hypothetical protein
MKILKGLLYVFPFLITVIIFLYFQKPERRTQNTSENNSLTEVTNNVFESWYEVKKPCMAPDFFEGFNIKKDTTVFKFSDLDETKKSLFKMLYMGRVKKEISNFNYSTLSDSQKIKIKDLENLCDKQLEQNKQKIYNLNSSNLHPYDKDFLEKLDVYIFN